MGLVFQAEPFCQAGVGAVTVSSSGLSASTSYSYTLTKVGDSAPTQEGNFQRSTVPFTLSGLANGQYVLVANDDNDSAVFGQRNFSINCGSALSLDLAQPTNATATGGGTLTVRASGGVNPLFSAISSQATRQQLMPNAQGQLETVFLNVPAGSYNGAVSDSSNPAQSVLFNFVIEPYTPPVRRGCTDPAADNYDPQATQDDDSCVYTPVVRVPYFEVPAMQSLRFVQLNRLDKPAFDNTLLADERPLDYTNPGYCQKVEQGDTLVLQALSNYQGAPVLTIKACGTGNVVLTAPGQLVQQGAGQTPTFECYIKPDPASGFSRIYFNDEALPLPFLPGQRVTISTTGTSLDGTYPLHDVLEDAAAAVPYLRILSPYPAGSIRIDGELTTTYAVQVYDTYQFVVPFLGVLMGCYFAEITANDSDFSQALAQSEPIDVAPVHADTLLLSYRNFDNDFGINYSHGQVNRLRFTGRFFDRVPTGEKTVFRDDDSELVILSASVYRKVKLEALLLPGWLHEVLFVAFGHDAVRLDGVAVVLEGDYTYEPVERYTRGKGTATLEVQSFLGAGNRDDLGEPGDDGDFLEVNGKFLAVNI